MTADTALNIHQETDLPCSSAEYPVPHSITQSVIFTISPPPHPNTGSHLFTFTSITSPPSFSSFVCRTLSLLSCLCLVSVCLCLVSSVSSITRLSTPPISASSCHSRQDRFQETQTIASRLQILPVALVSILPSTLHTSSHPLVPLLYSR